MNDRPIRPGKVVRLNSGNPAMTVVRKVPAAWECTRFDGDQARLATFVEFDLSVQGPAKIEGRLPREAELTGFDPDEDSHRFKFC